MIIGACGFGATGSSIVTDYLEEYGHIQIVGPTEFDWVGQPDGLIDLEYHLKHPHGRYSDSYKAIERYIQMCKQKEYMINHLGSASFTEFMGSVCSFINEITQTQWATSYDLQLGNSLIDKIHRIFLYKTGYIQKWEKIHKRQWEKHPYKEMRFSVNPQDFDVLAKKHVMDVISLMGVDFNRPIAFDQPFSGENPQACFKYFDDPYAIVVDRDPRDLYIYGKLYLPGQFGYHIMPLNDVKKYVSFYRGLRDNQPYKEKNDRVLSLDMEDLIYKYDETTAKLRVFLKLPENPNPKTLFNPALSIGNTQLWLKYPQFAKDVEYIERELPEYLYDFTGCPTPGKDVNMFGERPT